MAAAVPPGCALRFAGFSVDPSTGRLYRGATRIPLRGKSFEVLLALLEQPGRVVTRDQLRRRLWPDDVFVDFENNLNTAVARLREALNDRAARPKYIETIPRRGYRFIGQLIPPLAGAGKGPVRLIVLPLANLSGDPSQDHFCDALTEDLIADLSAMAPRELAVIARTTAMFYRTCSADIARIGRELNVHYAVESSLRVSGQDFRFVVQLIRTSDQMHVWAQAYEAPLAQLLRVKSAAAREIARQAGANPAEPPPRPAPDPAAYRLYLEGRFRMAQLTRESMTQAAGLLEEAMARDPGFAPAYDALSELLWWQGFLALVHPREAFGRGLWLAHRAVEIDPGLAETHALLGMYLKEIDYGWDEVARQMQRALDLNPSSSVVRFRNALSGLMPHGRLSEATAELERALELDPLSVQIRMWLAQILHFARDNERAETEIHAALQMDPGFCWNHHVLGQIQLALGRYPAAIGAFRQGAALSGNHPIILGWLGMALAMCGGEAEARAVLESLRQAAAAAYIPPTSLAWIHLGLGEADAAFRCMFEAVEQRDPIIVPLKSYWFLDPLRADQRYGELLRRLRLDRRAGRPDPASQE
jgi:TolB-like protein/DNA-binding winged helix-turn-helix (wHTH) protein/Tfp pilus assembly protein PilF